MTSGGAVLQFSCVCALVGMLFKPIPINSGLTLASDPWAQTATVATTIGVTTTAVNSDADCSKDVNCKQCGANKLCQTCDNFFYLYESTSMSFVRLTPSYLYGTRHFFA